MIKNIKKYILILISIYAFWIWGLPLIFSSTLSVVLENISLNNNYAIEFSNPKLKMSILPVAVIRAEELTLRGKNSENRIAINSPEIKLRLLPLLSGRIHINKITANDIELKAVLKKEVELDKDFFKQISKSNVKCDEVKIEQFKLILHPKNSKKVAVYSGKNVLYKRNNRYLKLFTDSKFELNGTVSETRINLFLPKNNDLKKSIVDVKINNLNITPIGDFLRQYLPNDLVEAKGLINANIDNKELTAKIENCSIIMKDDAKSIFFPDVLNINSKFTITSKVINFENINIDSKNIHTILKGRITNYLDKPVTALDINVQLDKSKVEDIINLIPPIVVEDFNVYKLKKYKFYGNAIGNFTIKGDTCEPDIVGDIYIDNGVLIKPINNAGGATIKLDFTGRYINFDVVVPAGGFEKVWVKGGAELYNVKYSDMRIWSTKNVDLETAESKVVPLHEILNFVIGPVPIMDIKGHGNIDIIVKGNRKNPHVWGGLNFYDVKTFFKEIPNLVLTNSNAVLTFNDQSASFITKKGLINKKNVNIKGVCNLEGKFDFDVNSNNQELSYLYKAIQTSTMIDDVKSMLPKLDLCQGPINMKMRVFGAVKEIEDLAFNKNFFAKGKFEFLGNTFVMQGVSLKNTRGVVEFDGQNAAGNINASVGNSALNAKAVVKNNIADIDVVIPKLNLNDVLTNKSDLQNDIGNIFVNIVAKYKGKVDNIEYDKVYFLAKVLGAAQNNKLKVSTGEVSLNKNKLVVKNLKGMIADSLFNINLNADNVTSNPNINGIINLKAFELSSLNSLANYSIVPTDIKNRLKTIKFDSGKKINLKATISHNKVNAYMDLGGISFVYTPFELPVKIINGSLIMRNDTLRLNKINLLADGMPILADGAVNNIFSKPNFNLYANSKPKQDFIDKYINKNQVYPIKIKGDIVYTLRAKGTSDNFDFNANVDMARDSSIYHLGATVGDIENTIVLNLNSKILKQKIVKIKEFSYDKIISSQSGKNTRLNMLHAQGSIEVLNGDLKFQDLVIKTQNPTDARIFNIIFRKPNIKQGQFTSDLRFNGTLLNPKVLGIFHIFETNIPFLDTTMKNITFVFKDKFIELHSTGEVLGNDIKVRALLRNRLVPPYYVEKAALDTKLLDLNYITNKIKLSQVDNSHALESFEGFDITTVIIKNMKLNADSIHLRNIVADDFEAVASFNEKKLLNVHEFKFHIANGTLDGSFIYNLLNNNTTLKMKARDIDANDLSIALFDLRNQIYGDLTGDIKLSCNGADFDNCMRTLNGRTTFNVINGKMPKLGSLEYLLKAGNLVKGGLTGVSINSVIDIITPLKTGEFSDIIGDITIKDGLANDIEIATRGKDLSLFINGTYNFSTSNAEMEVLGLLSKKISTMFGPIGNISINTLFNVIPGVNLSKDTKILEHINRIPGIEITNKAFRKFIAEIKGNINGDNYVTSFKWIN